MERSTKFWGAKRQFSYSKQLGKLTSQICVSTFSTCPMEYKHFHLLGFTSNFFIIFEPFKSICVTCITYESIMNACEIITQDLEHLQQSLSIQVLLPQPPTSATHLTSI